MADYNASERLRGPAIDIGQRGAVKIAPQDSIQNKFNAASKAKVTSKIRNPGSDKPTTATETEARETTDKMMKAKRKVNLEGLKDGITERLESLPERDPVEMGAPILSGVTGSVMKAPPSDSFSDLKHSRMTAAKNALKP